MPLTLYIVRHAKAEDRSVFMTDHSRELTSDGIMAAARIGRYLRSKGAQPAAIVSSTAPRAKDTAKVIAEQLDFDIAHIRLIDALYEGGPKAYLAAVNAFPADATSAMIVGHNPDVTYFAEFLTHQSVGSMSKGAVVAITFADVTWSEVSGRTGNIAFEIAPKELPKDL